MTIIQYINSWIVSHRKKLLIQAMKVKCNVTVNNKFIFMMRNNLKIKSVFKPVSVIFVGSVACCCLLMKDDPHSMNVNKTSNGRSSKTQTV